MRFYSSDEYAKAMSPDCAYFMAMPIQVYVGQENVIFGKATEGLGTDGISPEELRV